MPSVAFQSLEDGDKRDALEVAAGTIGRRAHLLEKDVWVVHTLKALIETPFDSHLTLKGGTSLSKAYKITSRFSEDLDVTYDIRAIAPDLVPNGSEEPLPATRSQERRWTREIRGRLSSWIESDAIPTLQANFASLKLPVQIFHAAQRIHIRYQPVVLGYGFVNPEVLVEFGARSTGEPRQQRLVECDVAPSLPEVEFPSVNPQVMMAERTFWEKATAAHVFCRQGRSRGERLSRHWHDLVRLDNTGFARSALSNSELALSVARHKSMFFREKDEAGTWIDYRAAVMGGLQLVPEGQFYQALARDYDGMARDGMLPDDGETFEALMSRSADLQDRANRL